MDSTYLYVDQVAFFNLLLTLLALEPRGEERR